VVPRCQLLSHLSESLCVCTTNLDQQATNNIQTVTMDSFEEDDPLVTKDLEDIVGGKGNYLFTYDGRKIFDAATGAAVSCLGHGNERLESALDEVKATGTPYLASSFWSNKWARELRKELREGTNGEMQGIFLSGSGSEAMEAAMKLACQYFYVKNTETTRRTFIAREGSYHGNTIGALNLSCFPARQEPYEALRLENKVHHISSCNPYHERKTNESDFDFLQRKVQELEKKFEELGPETIIAFVMEPVVGAALGVVLPVPGYLKAMRDICHKYGALLILDEVMCGMGRTGTLHAWQEENVPPDIQVIAKGLAAGYGAISATMASKKIVETLKKRKSTFIHGLTYQSMPLAVRPALEVQRMLKEDHLLENVLKQGAYLGKLLRSILGHHPNVGDIRGKGLLWGIEFVKDKKGKEPFDPQIGVAYGIKALALTEPFNMTVYPCCGKNDGVYGDCIILAPTFTILDNEIEHIVFTISSVISKYFSDLIQ
jgi:adenosylmethionine-8-amino-7-oxononanoate aminotransferase